ncbi:MAG: hypothetical protein Q7S02_01715 [bacterium]|nr:hypothetical protein [bacterium]
MMIAALAGCATMTDANGPQQTSALQENRCDLAKVLPEYHFPGFKPDHHGAADFDGKLCAGFGYTYYNEARVKFVDELDTERLHVEIDRVIAAYRTVFAKIAEIPDDRGTAVGILDGAMCYPHYNDGWGNSVSPPALRMVSTAFVEDPEGKLGGPSYPRLLLMRAVALGDADATRQLVGMFENAGRLDTRVDDRVTSNCGIGMNFAYRSQISAHLNAHEIDAALTFVEQFRFLATNSVVEETIGRRYGNGAPNDLQTIARDVITERIAHGDYAYARTVADRFGVTTAEVQTLAMERLRSAYEHAFRAKDLSGVPESARVLQEEFAFTDDDLERMQVVGYADAGFRMMYAPCSPMAHCEHFGEIEPRLADLSHESRTIIVRGLLQRYRGVRIDDLKKTHDFMRVAGVTTDEILDALALAMVGSADSAHAMQQAPGRYPNLTDYAQAIVYAVDRMGFDPSATYKASTCDTKPEDYGDLIGVWFLRCSNGVAFARTVVAEE